MPQNFHLRLSDGQVNSLVTYLLARQGPEPTPVPIGDGLAAIPAPKTTGAAKVVAQAPSPNFPVATAGIIIILLVAAISGFLILKNRS